MTDKIQLPTHYTGQPSGYYKKSGSNYNSVHDAAEAEWVDPPYLYHNIQHVKGGSTFFINRGLFTVDLTDFPLDANLTQIYLKCPASTIQVSEPSDIYITIVDGRDIYGESGAFGIFKNRTEPLGQACIPAETPYTVITFKIPFNAAGWELLNSHAGEALTLGVRIDKDIEGITPAATQFLAFYTSDAPYPSWRGYLWVEYNASPGYIWVNRQNISLGNSGTKLAYIDANCAKRVKEGTDTGANGSAEYPWVDGTYLYYVDYNGDVRRIEGTLTGLTDKVSSQISINTKSGIDGTKLCYIDDTGAERCFEGTIG